MILNRIPLVTIITPSFNQGCYIEETIKSVLSQTYLNIEYIVMDGGSTDNTIEILDKYKEKVKYISKKDKGQADAINKGFKMAKGEIIGWINSDDILDCKCVELVVKEFLSDDSVGLVYGNYININKDGSAINTVKRDNISLERLLNVDSALSQPGSFYRKKVVAQANFLDENLKYVMDYDLWIKILKASNIKYLDNVLAYFRLHDQSKTVSQINNFAPEIDKVLKKYGGSVYALPCEYLKENYYDKWFLRMQDIIKKVFGNYLGRNIGIYATGTHTKSMLQICNEIYGIKNFNIFMFDSNKDKWRKNFCGYDILSPEEISNCDLDEIIISSFSFQDEIYEVIKKYVTNEAKIIKLYDKKINCTFFV